MVLSNRASSTRRNLASLPLIVTRIIHIFVADLLRIIVPSVFVVAGHKRNLDWWMGRLLVLFLRIMVGIRN